MNLKTRISGAVIFCTLGVVIYISMNDSGIVTRGRKPSSTPAAGIRVDIGKPEPAGKEKMASTLHPDNPAGDKGDTHYKMAVFDSLQDLYGAVIHHPGGQVQAILDLVRMLKKLYPGTWEDHVREHLAQAFPDYAGELLDHYEKLQAFTQWADENRQALSGLPPYEIRERIRVARLDIFGDQAEVIWEMELKHEDAKKVLGDLEERSGMSFAEKTAYYSEQLSDIYGDGSKAYVKAHQQELIDQFLVVDSVQDDLNAMGEGERKEQLAGLRKSMGFDDDALKRWGRLDDERDKRWARGLAYMHERENLLASGQSENQDEKLDRLRRSFFGDSLAETIREEEASGMYRFTRKRIYGKN